MKVIFLDRDGVINAFPGHGNYVTKVKDFHFIPGSLKAIKLLTDWGYKIFVISNQAGVAKGVYTKDKLKRITNKMLRGVKKEGGKIQKVFYCTHRSDHGCECRKPQIGSVSKAFSLLKKSPRHIKSGFFVGDAHSDIKAGKKAGLKTILVLSGKENRGIVRKWDTKPDFIAKNLLQATRIITNENSNNTRLSRRRTSKSR